MIAITNLHLGFSQKKSEVENSRGAIPRQEIKIEFTIVMEIKKKKKLKKLIAV